MERVLARPNMGEILRPKGALGRVQKNRGGPGVDGMTVEDLVPYLWEHWEAIKSSLLDGTYQPSPVRRKEIPKRSGGVRTLGIPTVLDRLIQQVLLQVLPPQFDPTFSDHSYGFRPSRSAHGAIRTAQRYVQEGRKVVVDVDVEKFFDRVNHDVLMSRLARRIADRRVLGLIRRKAVRSRRCSRTCCWTKWIRSWSDVAMRLCATRTTGESSSGRGERARA